MIVAGIDAGTQSIKVVVYDSASHKLIASSSEPLPLIEEEGGVREQEAGWWIDAIRKCFGALDADIRKEIRVISISGQQHGFVPLSADGKVLYNVKLWCDTSTAAECGEIEEKLGGRIQLIGDDLFTTNIERIRNGVKLGALNAVLIKMNQIGTITETMDAIEFTKNSGYLPVVSARSGETEDDTIVHLAIATNAGQLKVGSVARTERAVKWNEAIRMEELLGRDGVYPGKAIFDQIRK